MLTAPFLNYMLSNSVFILLSILDMCVVGGSAHTCILKLEILISFLKVVIIRHERI